MRGQFAEFDPRPAMALWLVLVCGCATCFPKRSLEFRTVDAATGKPIEGVYAQRRSDNRMIGIPFFPGTPGAFALQTSARNGTIVAEGLCSDLKHEFLFRKAGYLDAHAQWAEGGVMLLDLPPGDPHHDQRGRIARQTGAVEIDLYPERTAVAVYRPVWTAVTKPAPSIVQVAERAAQKQHPQISNEWHSDPGAVQVFKNQYGDYQVLWLARDKVRGGFQWERVEITPPDDVTGYASGADHAASTPADVRGLR